MMDDVKQVLFFLQTLHYRDDLEERLYSNLGKFIHVDVMTAFDLDNIFSEKVHPELIKNVLNTLMNFGVIVKQDGNYKVIEQQLRTFIKMTQIAKASREYAWPSIRSKPFLYVSPPSIITTELSEEIDDISNLVTSLVSSSKKSVNIMSPFTNKIGLSTILSPLKGCAHVPEISIFLTANIKDQLKIYRQIYQLIPARMLGKLKIYFCSSEKVGDDYLPHAKLLIIDSNRGYLGSANFTKQGLSSRFEVGIELDQQQSKSVNKLFQMLIEKKIYSEYI